MVKQLGPILFMVALGGTALAQQPSPTTVRLGAPSLVAPHAIAWGSARPTPIRPPPPMPPPPTPAGPLELLLLAVTKGF